MFNFGANPESKNILFRHDTKRKQGFHSLPGEEINHTGTLHYYFSGY